MKRRGRMHRCGHSMCPIGSEIQSLLFDKDRFTVADAKRWAKKHHYKTGDVDIKGEFIHLRQKPPGRFKRVRTKLLGGSGVEARVGWKQCRGK